MFAVFTAVALLESLLITARSPEGFDAGGTTPLSHQSLLSLWPQMLQSGNVTQHLEVVKPLHIPFKEPLPEGIYKKLSADVAKTAAAVVGGGPGSGHRFKPLRYEVSVKLEKTSCEGADGTSVSYPDASGGEPVGGHHVKEALKLSNGFSVVIMDMMYVSDVVGRACDKLAEFHGSFCYANWYITPMRSCAYLPHIDAEENYVVQLAGAKRWKFYNTTRLHPLLDLCYSPDDEHPCDDEFEPVQAARDAERFGDGQLKAITLLPGDLLYVPRGLIHDAEVDSKFKRYGQHSSHITFAVGAGLTWSDLFAGLLNAKADEDAKFGRDVRSPACAAIASMVTQEVDSDAKLAGQRGHTCPDKLTKAKLSWLSLATFFIKFAARLNVDLRRMVRKGTHGTTELAVGLEVALEQLRGTLMAKEVADGRPQGKRGLQHPVVQMLQYANSKRLLGSTFRNPSKLGLSKGAWLDKLQSGLQSKLDVAFMGALSGKLDEGSQKALLQKTMTLTKRSAMKNKKENKKYDKERIEVLKSGIGN